MRAARLVFGAMLLSQLAAVRGAPQSRPAEDPELAALFSSHGIEGTIVISALKEERRDVHNPARASRRFLPASTFKIPNALIALAEGAVRDPDELIKWDGTRRSISSWNQDHTLQSAFAVSCVWCFQELAQRVGHDAYRNHLVRMRYGNQRPEPTLTTFWLEGELRISAHEQVDFLRRLYRGELPYAPEHLKHLKQIMIVERKPGYTLRAKTGWAARAEPQHGWFVGWVEGKRGVWFFATNIEIREKADLALRRSLTLDALRLKGIVDR